MPFLRNLAIALCLMALPSCSDAPLPVDRAAIAPPLYEIVARDGAVEGWMFGTIHALPDDVSWRTPALESVIDRADLLVVEVAAIADDAALAATFTELGTAEQSVPLTERVPQGQSAAVADLAKRSGIVGLDRLETWAAALVLARVDAAGDAGNGVDRALLKDFAARPVVELEGLRAQLSIFDRLPERDQRALLAAVVANPEGAREEAERLQIAWLKGDTAVIETATRTGFLAEDTLRNVLLVQRNRDWVPSILARLKAGPRPLIAVGAMHIVGADGLARMLEMSGYSIRRVPEGLAPPG